MAATGLGLTSPTGANQYTDQAYRLPTMGQNPASMAKEGTGFEMFAAPSMAGVAGGAAPPGVVPQQSDPINTTVGPGIQQGTTYTGPYDPNNPIGGSGGVKNVGSGAETVTTLFPQFTAQFFNYLQSKMGKGATPFNLSTALPGGGHTDPGQLNAPLNDVNSMLQNFYKTGSGGPAGTDALGSMAKSGNPTDVGPAWEAMKAAQQRTIDQQGANLREQFAFGGDLKSSPFGQAATDFYSQTAKDQNSLLAQMQAQAQESAANRQLTAGEDLTKGGQDFGSMLQSLDQQSIQNLLAEFVRTSPEYSPFLSQLGGAATTFPPTISGSVGVGGLGGAVSSAGTALSGIADLWNSIGNNKSTTATPAG